MTQLLSLEDAKALRDAMTRGPWKAWNGGKLVEVWAKEGSRRPVIKWTGFEASDRPLKEQVANARAIASLPDLLTSYTTVLELLRRIEPHLDSIICYASTMGEHEPNRLAHDVRTTLKETAGDD